MRTKISFTKIILFSLILVFSLLLNPVAANNLSENNASNNVINEYLLVANNKTHLADNIFNISVEDTTEFRILDNTSKKFTTSGTVKSVKFDKPLEIDPHDFKEYIKDVLKGLWSKVTGGESTSGNNSEYYAEYKFPETSEDYPVDVMGEYNSIPTKNKIIINVKTKYIIKSVANMGKTYQLASMKNLSSRRFKYHSVNHGQNAEELIKNINEFLSVSNELQNKISNLTTNPKESELKSLPVEKVLEFQKNLEDSIEKFNDVAKNDLIKEKLREQLDSINKDSNQVLEELSSNLNTKKENLLKEELVSAQKLEEKRIGEFSTAKSDFRNDVFIPSGALVVLGLIIGYFNVNRWKKESEYFGLYTSKANITSPITITIILTVVISILIGIIISIEGDLNMFKFLI